MCIENNIIRDGLRFGDLFLFQNRLPLPSNLTVNKAPRPYIFYECPGIPDDENVVISLNHLFSMQCVIHRIPHRAADKIDVRSLWSRGNHLSENGIRCFVMHEYRELWFFEVDHSEYFFCRTFLRYSESKILLPRS